MKVKVIEDKCIGCGQCEAVCPDVFQIGDEGFAEVVTNEFKEELIDDIKMAASGCPTDAIEVNEKEECNCQECHCDDEDCDCEECGCDDEEDTECNCKHCHCSDEEK